MAAFGSGIWSPVKISRYFWKLVLVLIANLWFWDLVPCEDIQIFLEIGSGFDSKPLLLGSGPL